MRIRTILATLAAGALVFAGSTAAGAATPAASPGTIYTTSSAGYQTVNSTWHLRFVTAATVLPNPSAALDSDGDTMLATVPAAGFGVSLADKIQSISIGISWGGAAWNVNVYQAQPGGAGYDCNNGGGISGVNCSTGVGFSNGNQFAPGTSVQLELYYNNGGDDSVKWTVLANGVQVAQDYIPGPQVWNSVTAGGGAFGVASAGGDIGSSYTAPKESYRLFAVTGMAVTSYDGAHGSMSGPWPTAQDVATSNGKSSGTKEASAPVLFGGGTETGVQVQP